MITAQILLDGDVRPDGGIVVIEDLGTVDTADVLTEGGLLAGYDATAHSVDVYTCSADDAAVARRGVRVRVYSGDHVNGLGPAIFDGQLDITSGVLAIGQTWHHPHEMYHVPLPHPGPRRVRIYAAAARPPSRPNDLVVLIPPVS